jgi:ABC-type sugar transport system substrate-binding protein
MRNSLTAVLLGAALLAGAPAMAATDAVSQCQSETLVMGTYVYQNGVFTAIENGTAEGAAALNACVQAKANADGPRPRVMNVFTLLPPERAPRCSLTMVGGSGYLCRPTRY